MSAAVLQHKLSVRLWHWTNAITFFALLVSGIGIILYTPMFYWGETGYLGMDAWLTIPIEPDKGQTGWGRNVHFLFAWIFVINAFLYMISGLVSGHFYRKFLPSREQMRIKQIAAEFARQLSFRRTKPHELITYNPLQKITYLFVIFVMFPVMLLSGMTMSPGFVAALPGLTDLFGGRQSARSIHFIVANLLTLFLVIHLLKVMLGGPVRMVGAMITGSLKSSEDPE